MTARKNTIFLLTIALVFFSVFGIAQNAKIDSLESEFLRVKTNEQKSQILDALFNEVSDIDVDKALRVALEYRNINRSVQASSARYLQGLNLTGIAYMNLNKNDSALFYFENLIEASRKEQDSVFLSKGYNNLGALNFETDNYSTAIFYMNKTAEIDERLGDLKGSLVSYMNIGAIYTAMGTTDSARQFLSKALEVAAVVGDNSLIATCYLNLGAVESKAKNFEKAEFFILKALEFAELVDNFDIISSAYRNMSIVKQSQSDYADALGYDFKALEFGLKSNILDNVISARRGLALSYEKMGRFKEALSNYKEFMTLQDSLEDLENTEQVIEMKEKYKADQAVKENEILSQKTKIQDLEIEKNAEEIQNSKIVIISSILGLVLLVVLAITLYNRNVIKQRANLKLQEANEIIQEKNSDILASIEYASKIQEALLPTKDDSSLFPDSFFLLRPKDIVSGDFLWYAELDGKKIFAAVDCTGHGVPGAFMSMIGNTFLHQIINERGITNPSIILNELRKNVVRALNQKGNGVNRKDGMDMALCVYNEQTRCLEFSGANNPLLLIRNGEFREVKGDKQPVGFFEGHETDFTRHEIQLEQGDCIYVMSDGYVDQFGGPKGKKFKYKRLIEVLVSLCKEPMQTQKTVLNKTFDEWKGELEQVDDVCIVGVRIV